MSTKPVTKTEVLIAVRKELNKQGFIYDGSARTSKIYTAPLHAEVGDYCHVREFLYYPSTNTVKGRKEGYALWLQEFETAFLGLDNLVDEINDDLVDEGSDQLTG